MKETVFHITYRPAVEFLYAFVYSAIDKIKPMLTELPGIADKSLIQCMDKLNAGLSNYIKSEIRYFTLGGENECCGIAQDIIMRVLKTNREIQTEQQLLDRLNDIPAIEMSKILFCSSIKEFPIAEHLIPEGKAAREEALKNLTTKEMLDCIKKLPFADEDRKAVILDAIEYYEELKERLLAVLQNFYQNAYKELYADMQEKIQPWIKVYEEEMNQDKAAFFHKYHNCSLDAYEDELFIHLSYTKFAGVDMYTSEAGIDEWFILGIHTRELLGQDIEDEDTILGFLKTVSDKKRMQMIQRLKKQPAFVNEIAEEMKMTAATASYHLTALQEYDIVDFERSEHRLYYHLNQDKLEEWFDKAKQFYR